MAGFGCGPGRFRSGKQSCHIPAGAAGARESVDGLAFPEVVVGRFFPPAVIDQLGDGAAAQHKKAPEDHQQGAHARPSSLSEVADEGALSRQAMKRPVPRTLIATNRMIANSNVAPDTCAPGRGP